MILSDLSIRRPVLATVMSLVIILVGIISFLRLTVREYPNIDAPVVSVRTVYKGASAQVVESQITQPLEDSLSGIEGIKTIKSISREEVSQITVEFVSQRNVDSAANDVRDRAARVRARLPQAADESVVAKIEADALPIIWLALSSTRQNALEITDYADRFIADSLKTLPGVASVIIGGERRYAMRIWLDRDRLAAHGLTAQDVEAALLRQNLEIPSGRIESQQREFTVLAEADLRTPQQFDQITIAEISGYAVRLRDVGHTELGAADERNLVRVNGNPAVGLGVVKQSTANTLDVSRAVKGQLDRLRPNLPEGMQLKVAYDTSLFIERSIQAVYESMLEAVLLVIAVIFIFLRSFRATLIPFVTIPVSLIGAFIFLNLFGFTINVLTLLGLVLAIGLVVDDAIVMLENIHRHIEAGMEPMEAALKGSKEIAFAVMAMTLTLVAVFQWRKFAFQGQAYAHRNRANQHEDATDQPMMAQRLAEQTPIAVVHPIKKTFQRVVELAVLFLMAQDAAAHHGRERERDKARHQHRQYRQTVHGIRAHRRIGGAGVRLCRAHAHAHDVQPHPAP